jgi:hypothetical protein
VVTSLLFAAFGITNAVGGLPFYRPVFPPDFPALLKEYKELGLPLPPKGARLVAFASSHRGRPDAPPYRVYYWYFLDPRYPQFLQPALQCGLLTRFAVDAPFISPAIDSSGWKLPDRNEYLSTVAGDQEPYNVVRHLPNWCALAIQVYHAGYPILAWQIWREHEGADYARGQHSVFSIDRERSRPRSMLHALAWIEAAQRLTDTDSDRRLLARRLWEICRRDPSLLTRERRAFMASLDQTIRRPPPRMKTMQTLIDRLRDYQAPVDTWLEPWERDRFEPWQPHPLLRPILLRAFAEMPTIIRHLDDQRLTRTYDAWYTRRGPAIHTIADVLGTIVHAYTGSESETDGAVLLDAWTAKAYGLNWWPKFRSCSEADILLNRVMFLRVSPFNGNSALPNSFALWILGQKYPERFADFVALYYSNPENPFLHEYGAALAGSRLAVDRKVAIFSALIMNPDHPLRIEALRFLKHADERAYRELLCALVKEGVDCIDRFDWKTRLPPELVRDFEWIDDPQAWNDLAMLCERYSARFGEFAVAEIKWLGEKRPNTDLAAWFLRRFVVEENVIWDQKQAAAHRLAPYYGIEAKPTEDWKHDDWNRLYEMVLAAVKKDLPGPKPQAPEQ